MPRFSKRNLAEFFACALVVSIATFRTYFAFVPHGVSFQPWTLGRVDGPEMRSPDGRRVVHVYFNDAGAAHSGNHWTWIVEDSWWYGRRVVAEGYLSPEVAVGGAPVPLEWGPANEITVKFLPRRYGH